MNYDNHYGAAVNHYRNLDDAREALHNVMVRCLPHRERIGEEAFPKYVMTALLNYTRTPYRSRVIKLGSKHISNMRGRSFSHNQLEIDNLLPHLLETLTPRQKELFLRYLEDPSRGNKSNRGAVHEIAEEYNMSPDSVHKMLQQAKNKIKEAYVRHT